MKQTLFINSTLGKHPIYFEETCKFLNERGIEAKNVLPKTWKLEEYENYIESMLKDGNKYSLIGWSYGGNVALNIAEKHPDKTDRLIIVDSILDWKYQPLKDRITTRVLGMLPDCLKEKAGSSDKLLRSMLNEMIDSDIDKRLYEDLVKITKEQSGKWNINALYDGIGYTAKENNTQKLKILAEEIDAHIIYASKDVEDYIKKTDLENSKVKIHKIENSGHLISLENPDDFNKTLLEILR